MNDPSPLEAIFFAALEKGTPEACAAYLDEACAGDPDLRLRVGKMLAAQAKAGSFLEQPASSPVATIEEQPFAECPGTIIGSYKLLEQIGEGGMGLVFVAEQQQPVRRKVALKVIKPGMDTRQVVARFGAERQALALMEHPSIAKVLDGGETASGRPYFVMELVKGVPITEYCDHNQVSVPERLELFLHVCQAVQHAHQKGIIHRDLKPSNVLVMSQDGTPLVKVIDFGVAKAIGQRLTEKTVYTQFTQLVGTPLYMSPEQAGQSGIDVDTRTDLYALGVLLYELLTGTTPFDRERLREVDYEELRRIIREEEPPRPSTRISTLGQAATTVSTQRRSDPKQLSRLCRGELDWIVMKALEKDRNRRYETASSFAADVQRYLHDEPVLACPPSVWYRLRKFGQRHRAVLAALVLIAAALLTSIVVLVTSNISITSKEKEKSEALDAKNAALKDKSQALDAKEAALRAANASRQKAEANLALVLAALDDVYITEAERRFNASTNDAHKPPGAQSPQPAPLDPAFLQKGIGFYERLIQPGSAEPAARFQTGKAYRRVGILRWDLKQYDKADDCLAKAISLLAKLAEESPTEPQYRAELGEAYRWQGKTWLTAEYRRLPESEQAFRRAIALDDRLVAEFPADASYRRHAAWCRADLGLVLRYMARIEEAEAVFLETLKLWQHLAADFPTDRWNRFEAAYLLDSLGVLWQLEDRPEKAAPFFRQALDYHEKLVAENPTIDDSRERLARSYTNLADVLRRNGRVPEVAVAKRAVQLYPTNGRFWSTLGISHYRAGDFANAIAVLKQSLALSGANADTFFFLAMASWRQGQKDQARQWYQAAVLRMDFGLPWRWDTRSPRFRQEADALMGTDQGLTPAATQTKADDPDTYTRIIAAQPEAAWAYQLRGQIHRRLRDLPQADADARKAFQLLTRNLPPGTEALKELEQASSMHLRSNSWDMVILVNSRALELKGDEPRCRGERGFAYIVLEQYREAASDYTRVIARNPSLANSYARRGYAYLRSGERDKALADYAKVLDLNHDYSGDGWSRRCAMLLGGELGQWKDDKAFVDFCKAIEVGPKDATALNSLAWILATSPDPKSRDGGKAVRMARKAVELAPTDGALWNTLGAAHYRAGNCKEAIAALEKSLSLQGDNAFDCFFLAMACWQLEEKAKARTWFAQAVHGMEKSHARDEQLGRFRAEAAELLGIKDATK